MSFRLTSTAFTDGQPIPKKHTGDGVDVAAAAAARLGLMCRRKTARVALLCDDPDAPRGDWVHWVLFNIPADRTTLDEGVPPDATLADGSIQGKNDFGNLGYGGPAPPRGKPHRYFFKLYALDSALVLPAGATKAQLHAAIKGHLLAETQLMGTYQR